MADAGEAKTIAKRMEDSASAHRGAMRTSWESFEKKMDSRVKTMLDLIEVQDQEIRGGHGPDAAPGMKQRLSTTEIDIKAIKENLFPWKKILTTLIISALGGSGLIGAVVLVIITLLKQPK
jgi:hypothetical protein